MREPNRSVNQERPEARPPELLPAVVEPLALGFLAPADFTAKTRDRVIPSGTALAISGKKVVPYDQAGGGDSAKLVGFLLTDQPSDRGRLAVPVVDHVRVKIANLPDTGFAVPAAGNDLTSCVYIPKGA